MTGSDGGRHWPWILSHTHTYTHPTFLFGGGDFLPRSCLLSPTSRGIPFPGIKTVVLLNLPLYTPCLDHPGFYWFTPSANWEAWRRKRFEGTGAEGGRPSAIATPAPFPPVRPGVQGAGVGF